MLIGGSRREVGAYMESALGRIPASVRRDGRVINVSLEYVRPALTEGALDRMNVIAFMAGKAPIARLL